MALKQQLSCVNDNIMYFTHLTFSFLVLQITVQQQNAGVFDAPGKAK